MSLEKHAEVARRLPTELDAARRERIPLTPADLQDITAVPNHLNAAPLYRRIHAIYSAIPDAQRRREGDVPKLARSANPQDRRKASAIIEGRSNQLLLLVSAVNLPNSDFQRPYEQGPEMMLPEYASLRDLARVLAAKAMLEGKDARINDAFKTIGAGMKMGRHVGQEPILIAALVNIAIYAIMDSAFREVVLSNLDNPAVIKIARENIHPTDLPALEHMFAAEAVLCRVTCDLIRRHPDYAEVTLGTAAPVDFLVPFTDDRRRIKADAWETRTLEFWRRVFAAIRKHPGNLIAQYNEAKTVFDDSESHDGEPTYEIAPVTMPNFRHAILKVAGAEELYRLRKNLIDLVEYRQNHGDWPDSLSKLPRTQEPDIFTGKPPIYRKTRAGFILYSVGDDFKDDGGQATRDEKTNAFDHVIQYPRPAPEATEGHPLPPRPSP